MKPINQPATRKCQNCDRRFRLSNWEKDDRKTCFTCEVAHKTVREFLFALTLTAKRPIEGTYLVDGYSLTIRKTDE